MFKPVALCHWPCCRCPCRPHRSCRRHCLHRRPCHRRCRCRRRHLQRCRRHCRRLRCRRHRRSLPRASRKSSPRSRRPPTHPSPRARHARRTGCTSTPRRLSLGSRPSHQTTPGGSVDRRPLEPRGNLLRVLRVTEVLRGRTWFALPLVARATWRTSTLFVLAYGQMEEKRELEEKQQMIEG
jgi:hypothetical protein